MSKKKKMSTEECWICFSSGEESLLQPCKCKGSVGLVHESCLLKWLSSSGHTTCTRCSHVYEKEIKYEASWHVYLDSSWIEIMGSVILCFVVYYVFSMVMNQFYIVQCLRKMHSWLYYSFIKMELSAAMTFGLFYLLNRFLNKDRCWTYIKRLLDIFEENYENMVHAFTTNRIWGSGDGTPTYTIGKIVFMTFYYFMKEIKSEWIRKKEVIKEYKEITVS